MKHSVRTFSSLLAALTLTTALSACGGRGAMNAAYTGYPQSYNQMNQMGQSQIAYAQTGYSQNQQTYLQQQQNAQSQTANLNPPMPQSYGQSFSSAEQTTSPAANTSRSTTATAAKSTTSTSSTAAKKNPLPTASKTPAKTASPAAAKTPSASDYLSKARQAMASTQSLTATVSTLEKGPKGSGSGKIQYTFLNNQVKIDVTASSDSSRQGVKLGYQVGGNQVKVRPSGILKMVSLNLAMNDQKLLSGRNYLIGQIDLAATVNRLTQPNLQAKVLGKTTFAGTEVIVIEIAGPCSFDAQITKEHLGLDAKTFMPRIHEMYQGSELVYAGRIEQLNVNPTLAANALEI